ncbi:hypothetical protein TNCV_2897821 [Trichonephila clavipes]|nr:hypothetical protein TNCV_2897821 [Trichonephila clavipes]
MMSQDYLLHIATHPWPTRFPNLSPIEHIWDHLGRQVGQPMSLVEQEARIKQLWCEISKCIIRNLCFNAR